jgi:hypothetical protein
MSLHRGYALDLIQQPMLSHPHATETECGTRTDYGIAFHLSHLRGTMKEGARLGQVPTGQDSLGPFNYQGSHRPRQSRRVVEINGLAEQCHRWLKTVYHLQRRGCLTGRLHGDGSVCGRATGGDEGVMRSAQQPLWVRPGP